MIFGALSVGKMLPTILKALPIILVAFVIGYLYIQNTGLKDVVETQQRNIAELHVAVQTQKDTIERQQKDIEQVIQANVDIQKSRDVQAEGLEALRRKFDKSNGLGERRDLAILATERPKSISRVINRASKNALRCLEISMGASLTDEEKSATERSEVNPLCFDIANPSFTNFN